MIIKKNHFVYIIIPDLFQFTPTPRVIVVEMGFSFEYVYFTLFTSSLSGVVRIWCSSSMNLKSISVQVFLLE
jgi:hypothetical protein